ncbi:MAG: DUF2723 domain-containing protein [Elusimicrobiota bacterium]
MLEARRPLAAALAAGIFGLYAFHAYPTYAPRDSADLAAAAVALAPAHPPGYPLYAVLGKAWTIALPLGDPAYRLNLLSAAAGALAAGAMFLFLSPAGGWAAAGGALTFAFSAPLWKFSLLCEMYSLQALFICLLLFLSRGGRGSAEKRACLSALLFGLGLVNHQALLLMTPALVWLWRSELSGHRLRAAGVLKPAAVFFALGTALYLFLWIKLDAGLAWAVLTRREYGSLQLFGGLSRPLTPDLAMSLLGHLAGGLLTGASVLAAALALLGAGVLARRDGALAAALALALAAFGPFFFLLTRFDLTEWVARSVLETSFLVPTLVVCALAAYGIAWLQEASGSRVVGAALALACAGSVLWGRAQTLDHRDDFSAYDYARDLRRALPPGSAAVAGGDTALFSARYEDLVRPRAARRLLHIQEGRQALLAAGTAFSLGLPLGAVQELSLGRPQARGLIQALRPQPPSLMWESTALRRSKALVGGESYAHDIRLSYAFARYVTGQLASAAGDEAAALRHYQAAAALDPEDYHLEYNKAP